MNKKLLITKRFYSVILFKKKKWKEYNLWKHTIKCYGSASQLHFQNRPWSSRYEGYEVRRRGKLEYSMWDNNKMSSATQDFLDV